MITIPFTELLADQGTQHNTNMQANTTMQDIAKFMVFLDDNESEVELLLDDIVLVGDSAGY